MVTILITGVAGLIGGKMSHWLAEHVPDVVLIGIDNLSGGFVENIHPSVKFIQADLCDENDYSRIEKEAFPCDYVFHFAAFAAECLSPFMRMHCVKTNILASSFLINMSIKHRVSRFIFSSSMACFGNQQPPFTEDLIPMPADPYGIAKYAIEMDLRVAYEQHGLEYFIARPHNVFGPGQNIWDCYRNVIGIWMYQSMNQKPMKIYGDGEQKRAFTYVDNILPCLWKGATSPHCKNQVVNLGGIQEYTINEINQRLCQLTKWNKIEYCPPRHEVRNAYCSYQKSIDLLDYSEDVDIDEGLARFWDWAQQQPRRERNIFDSYELDVGLYPYWKPENLS